MATAAARSVPIWTPACLVQLLATCLVALSPNAAFARTWRVPGDAATIQAGINLAQSGDDVLVGPGTYPEHDIVMKAGIWVHSEEGADATTVEAADAGTGFTCTDFAQQAVIEGFTIIHGHSRGDIEQGSGGGVRCLRSLLAVRNCVISSCVAEETGGGICSSGATIEIAGCRISGCTAMEGGGIEAGWWSDAAIMDCEIRDNFARGSGGGGIVAVGQEVSILRCTVTGNEAGDWSGGGIAVQSAGLTIRGCLVANNVVDDFHEGGGMAIYASAGVVEDCTVAKNRGVPVPPGALMLDSSTLAFKNTIVAINEGRAFSCSVSQVTFDCCDTFGNTGGDELCGDDLGGNFSADPLFCDAANGDYSLDGQSPCLPGWDHGGVDCGLIGARGQGCGTAPTGACCFPDGSCSALVSQQCADQHGAYQGNGTTCDPNPCHPTPTKSTTWGRIKSSFR